MEEQQVQSPEASQAGLKADENRCPPVSLMPATSIPNIYSDQRRGICLADQCGRFLESLPSRQAPARPTLKSTKSRPGAPPPFPHATSRLRRAGTGRSTEG